MINNKPDSSTMILLRLFIPRSNQSSVKVSAGTRLIHVFFFLFCVTFLGTAGEAVIKIKGFLNAKINKK